MVLKFMIIKARFQPTNRDYTMDDHTIVPVPSHFAVFYYDKLRFSDTDLLGHVNNSAFGKFFENGRTDVLYKGSEVIAPEGAFFVIAHLAIDFVAEMNWPAEVVVGTNATKTGRSSVTMDQAIFVDDKCVARAHSVIVLMSEATRRSTALPRALIEYFTGLKPPL